MKIGEATGNLFAGNAILGPANDVAFTQATSNVVRDSEIGKTVRVMLDSASSVSLEDSRGAAWLLSRSGLPTIVTPDGSTLTLTYANAGPAVSVPTIDLTVRPKSNMVAVQPTVWDAGSRSWNERASGAVGSVAHGVGGLQAGACYSVTANGKLLGLCKADSNSHISFTYGLSGTAGFVVTRSSQCVAPAPEHRLLLPLVRR